MSTSLEDLSNVQNSNSQLTPSIVNQLLNDINEASMKGDTQLLPRDIPMESEIDEETAPNYVPKGEKYIKPEKCKKDENLDKIYDEIQVPILLSIIYFLFQLPVFRMFMLRLFPFMFSSDGNSNIQGYFGFSILFGIFYYVISKVIIAVNF